uniref:Uncharacterized protein n=1 Tax=viral metagenome TaxID=1070528 RepID=A0A6C0AYC8_9ZZZZ|tara:strand:- start:932 stop:1510 length:579 start_codon:yes stop_codon:yes gene_type:complete
MSNSPDKISSVNTNNETIKLNSSANIDNTEFVVGGNIIANPNPSAFRSTEYIILSNISDIDYNLCEETVYFTSKQKCVDPEEIIPKGCNKKHLCLNTLVYQNQNKKVINNQVRQCSSLHTDNYVSKKYSVQNDSYVKKNVPTRGNSTKNSITSLRPGSLSAKGIGVHEKHGSYQRRYLKLKNNLYCDEKCNN